MSGKMRRQFAASTTLRYKWGKERAPGFIQFRPFLLVALSAFIRQRVFS